MALLKSVNGGSCKRFYQRGYHQAFRLEAELSAGNLSAFLTSFLCQLRFFKHQTLLNAKGRDALDVRHPELFRSLPKSDELLFIGGELPLQNADRRFSFNLTSSFKDFPNPRDIEHHVQFQRSKTVPNWLEPATLAWSFPIKLEEFRFGLQIFRPRIVLSMFGLTPVVEETLIIESNASQFHLYIECEHVKNSANIPFEYLDCFSVLSRSLSCILPDFNLAETYREVMARNS